MKHEIDSGTMADLNDLINLYWGDLWDSWLKANTYKGWTHLFIRLVKFKRRMQRSHNVSGLPCKHSCPVCGAVDDWFVYGEDRFFACHEHRIAWFGESVDRETLQLNNGAHNRGIETANIYSWVEFPIQRVDGNNNPF